MGATNSLGLRAMWGVHTDRYETDFLGKGVIALGWNDVGDLARLQPTRDAFRDVVEKMYPGNKPGAIANWAGQLFRFVHEMKVGDIVVYPHRWERTINIGVVDGGYFFAAGGVYRQQRNVTWKRTGLARTQFSQGALYEVGSALTLFSVRSHALEFEAALEGEVVAPPVEADGGVVEPATEDEPDAERIFETTRDFVVRVLATELKGHPLAHFVAHLLEAMGYRTQVSPEGPDRGVDIVAHRDELGLEPPIIKVQVKSTQASTRSLDPFLPSVSWPSTARPAPYSSLTPSLRFPATVDRRLHGRRHSDRPARRAGDAPGAADHLAEIYFRARRAGGAPGG